MRRGVALTAVAMATTAPVLAMLGSPMLVATAMVLMAAALAGAIWAGPRLTAHRVFIAAGAATAWAIGCATGLPDGPAGIPAAVLMLAVTWMLAREWPGRAPAVATTVALAAAYCVVGLAVSLASRQALAGSDLRYVVAGLVTGLLIGAAPLIRPGVDRFLDGTPASA